MMDILLFPVRLIAAILFMVFILGSPIAMFVMFLILTMGYTPKK